MRLFILTIMLITLSSQANAYSSGLSDNCRNGAFVAKPYEYCRGQYIKICVTQGYSKTWQWVCIR